MAQAQELCDHIVMIHNGQKVLDDPLSGDPRPLQMIGTSGASDAEVPQITIEVLPNDTDIEAEKERVRLGGTDGPGGTDRLALAIVASNAVLAAELPESAAPEPETGPESESEPELQEETGAGGAAVSDEVETTTGPVFGNFDLFVRPRLNNSIEGEIRDSLIRNIRSARFLAAGVDEQQINQLRSVRAERTTELTEDGGERGTLGEFKNFIPYGFMLAMLIPVFIGGQYLMTTTIEEKGSRVVEVLLSAVSPMQLMGGKILGQMFVGLAILVIYGGLGAGSLIVFSLTDLLGVFALVMMLVFFLVAYFTYASFMAAIGAAVNEMREAQSLLGPVMIPLMIPYALGIFIADDPNSTFARVCSFIPPINPFVMMLRVASTEPPPMWEVGLSLLVALVTCVVAVWLAAKIFRVGLLMHGKAPNLGTLIKWIRLA
jgi:ABC-2 type transport system permease protein